MTMRPPPDGQPIQLLGYSWGSGRLELLWAPWPSGDAAPRADERSATRWRVSPETVLALALAAPAERRCVGYHPPNGGPRRPCPEWRILPLGTHAQCARCEQREGRLEIVASDGSRPPTGPRAGYLRSAHEVYLAAFGAGVAKVGVSGAGRTPLRILEQGAPAGLVVARASDGMAARRLEHALAGCGLRERMPVRTKLRLLFPRPDVARLLGELAEVLVRVTEALPWPTAIERVWPSLAFDNALRMGLDRLPAAPVAAPPPPNATLAGEVLATAGALLVARQPQLSLWGAAAPSAPLAHDLRAWIGWKLVAT